MKSFTIFRPLLAGLLVAGMTVAVQAEEKKDPKKKVPAVWKHEMKKLDGTDARLSQYDGKVVLLVNVASQCGFTSQYADLQALQEKYKKQGLEVVGVPCNQFGGQEPGTAKEIASFCKVNYGVTFDILEKVEVNGKDQCGLYEFLTSKDTNPKHAGPIRWNFEKFLINRAGKVVGRYRSSVSPKDAELVKAVEMELK